MDNETEAEIYEAESKLLNTLEDIRHNFTLHSPVCLRGVLLNTYQEQFET
jgi:hypothetical protein